MATTKKYNIDWLCRTCMQELGDTNTEPQQQWLTIVDTIEKCGSLRITELVCNTLMHVKLELCDELPKKICQECIQSLEKAYQFQQTCLNSQQKLNTLCAKLSADDMEFLKQEPLVEETNQGIELGIVKTSSIHTCEADLTPIKETEVKVEGIQNEFLLEEHSVARVVLEMSDVTASSIAINQPTESHTYCLNVRDDDDESHPMNNVDNNTLIVETEKSQVDLDKPPHICHICDKSFRNRRYLKAHRTSHKRREEELANLSRNKNFADNKLNAEHDPSDDSEPNIQSIKKEQCVEDKSNGEDSVLVTNEPCRDNDEPYVKYAAYETINRSNTLENKVLIVEVEEAHISLNKDRQVTPVRPTHGCHLCNKTFKQRRYLTKHLKRHKKRDEAQEMHMKNKKCVEKEHCRDDDDDEHEINHEVLKPYACDYCDMTYHYPSMLMAHLKFVHTAEMLQNSQRESHAYPPF